MITLIGVISAGLLSGNYQSYATLIGSDLWDCGCNLDLFKSADINHCFIRVLADELSGYCLSAASTYKDYIQVGFSRLQQRFHWLLNHFNDIGLPAAVCFNQWEYNDKKKGQIQYMNSSGTIHMLIFFPFIYLNVWVEFWPKISWTSIYIWEILNHTTQILQNLWYATLTLYILYECCLFF